MRVHSPLEIDDGNECTLAFEFLGVLFARVRVENLLVKIDLPVN